MKLALFVLRRCSVLINLWYFDETGTAAVQFDLIHDKLGFGV